MTAGELALLQACLGSAVSYLEFGAGASTIHAASVPSIRRIDSVDSSGAYIDEHLRPHATVAAAQVAGRLTFHVVDIGATSKWGYPVDDSKKRQWPTYSQGVFSRPSDHDLVLVDGRFRVACALSSILNTPDDCRILIHDFRARPQYHVVTRFLERREQVDSLVLFAKKRGVSSERVRSLLRRYQYLPADRSIETIGAWIRHRAGRSPFR
ncbi:MAG: hypothetical protein ABL963_13085 [Longimicrobiales bacterium]